VEADAVGAAPTALLWRSCPAPALPPGLHCSLFLLRHESLASMANRPPPILPDTGLAARPCHLRGLRMPPPPFLGGASDGPPERLTYFPEPTRPPGTKNSQWAWPEPPAQPAGEHGPPRSLPGLAGLGPGRGGRPVWTCIVMSMFNLLHSPKLLRIPTNVLSLSSSNTDTFVFVEIF
jgi:hypothetical protein